MKILFDIFYDIRFHDIYWGIDKDDMIYVYGIGSIFMLAFCFISIICHHKDFYLRYRHRTFLGVIKSSLFLIISTFIIEYIVYFLFIQTPLVPLGIVFYFLSYVIRFAIRLAEAGLFYKLYTSCGEYFNDIERKNINRNNNKKAYLRFYKERISVNYKGI